MSVFIIAEAGVNHNGSVETAKKIIDAAYDSGANAVKFQTWKTDLIVTKDALSAHYQNKNIDNSQYDLLKNLELTYEDFIELKRYCDSVGILFLSTPDEIESARFLFSIQDIFKIGSGELNNPLLLREIGSYKKKVILSTGMGTFHEVETALNILISSGTKKNNITILHANTEYPTPMDDVNLNAMKNISDQLNIKVGYSDHTVGIEVPIAAVALGASCIEKHLTLDKSMKGPDHQASIEPIEFRKMVSAIRNIELAMGVKEKKPSKSEAKNINIVRKFIVASKLIKEGEVFTEKNLTTKRTLTGISASRWDDVMGKRAKKEFLENELIEI